MTIILVVCAAYILWCLYKTSRYLREHPEDLRWPDSPADSQVDAKKIQDSGKVDEISKPVV